MQTFNQTIVNTRSKSNFYYNLYTEKHRKDFPKCESKQLKDMYGRLLIEYYFSLPLQYNVYCRMKARNGSIKKTKRSFNEQKIQIRIKIMPETIPSPKFEII